MRDCVAQPRIGIIIGSTREGGFGDKPAAWIRSIASRRDDLQFEMIDLRNHPAPSFAEPMSPAWAPKLADLDGFIIVAPEYNHGPGAVLKQALKHADAEFVRKPLAFIGYGGVGAGRAIEQLQLVGAELQMVFVRNAVHLGTVEFLGVCQQGKSFDDFPHLAKSASGLLDELAWWTRTLKGARAATAR
jgi:NAD(P)H-dependent FMN reductase